MNLDLLLKILMESGRAKVVKAGNNYAAVVSTGNGRDQTVYLYPTTDVTGQAIIKYYTEIGRAFSDVVMRVALEANMKLPTGAFALNDGKLVMVDTQLFETADALEVVNSIIALAFAADGVEEQIFGKDSH